jgi:hypothetical protein
MKERKDAAFKRAAATWKKAKEAAGPAVKALEDAKAAVILLLGDEPAFGCGIVCLKKSRAGSVDYKQVPELRGVDLGPYRKADIEYFEISPQ